MDCIFCQIIAGKIPGQILYQDEEVIAFRDIKPEAPVHLLIIPRSHIPSVARLTDSTIVARMVDVANQLAKEEGISESGYRLVISCGKEGGQVVPHLHMHLLGGRRLLDTLG
jgi:histidine triad (HIT) family protein